MNHEPSTGTDRPANRLAGETSPYLRQHQYNPVDWYPWGDEAFEKARRENKPLLISIGYSACHWCHVMERESFENPEIARILNQAVVAVKVDREERPDVDKIYMEVCIALTGQGGWPLNVFVTPKLKPFYAGTYFPPDDRYGRPGFARVLQRINEAWITDSTGLTLQAAKLHDETDAHAKTLPGELSSNVWTKAIAEALSRFDDQRGGFGGAPKFPPDQWMAMLLAAGHYTGDKRAAGAVEFTLLRMAQGGIYDQLGGGFARYSVDADWLVPHFEKMLYNQALLVPVFVSAFKNNQETRFLQPAVETLDWVMRDLADDSGLYYCALDADSEGEEGRFYVWTPAQIREILEPREADAFIRRYGVTDRGNFEESTSILFVAKSYRQIATEMEIETDEATQLVQSAKVKLLEARAKREWPGLDYKCLTGWNGLMLTAFCAGYLATHDERYLQAARGIAEAAGRFLTIDGKLYRSYAEGKTSIPALLEDYAYLGNGLVDLYEVTGEDNFRMQAARIAEEILAQFDDEAQGGFFFHGQNDTNLISRTKSLNDDAIPSASACAAQLLFRLSAVEDNPHYQHRARAAVSAAAGGAERFAGSFASTLLAWTYAPENVVHVTLPEKNKDEFLVTATRNYLPGLVISYADRPGALVCKGTQCLTEATTVESLDLQLKGLMSD